MSAFVVDPETIATIASAAFTALEDAAARACAGIRPDAWASLVADLCDQNARSVAYRYQTSQDEAVQSFTGMHPRFWRARAARRLSGPIDPEALADACRCYRYQSCEHPEWEGSTADQITEALRLSAEARAKDQAAERARERGEAAARAIEDAIIKGRAWIAAHQPAGATHAIVAELHSDECDGQSDYFGSRVVRRVFLAWSRHGRDLFAEMRKAAATRPETAHLGPGRGQYMPRVTIERDFRSNGACYAKGDRSHWHSELEPEGPLSSAAEAADWIATHPAPEPVWFDDDLIPFGWRVDESTIEHREKYSMGRGYYLGTSSYSGWQVRKVPVGDWLAQIVGA